MPPQKRPHQVALTLPPQLRERLRSHAARTGLAVSEIIRTAATQYLDQQESQMSTGVVTVPMTAAEVAHPAGRLPGETPGKGGLWVVEKEGLFYNNSHIETNRAGRQGYVQWADTIRLASSFERRYWAERIAARFGGTVREYQPD